MELNQICEKAHVREKTRFEVSNKLVSVMNAFNEQSKRMTYGSFARIAHATGDATSPKFQPFFYQILKALPDDLDALVCRHDGTSKKYPNHRATREGWEVLEVSEEAAGKIAAAV